MAYRTQIIVQTLAFEVWRPELLGSLRILRAVWFHPQLQHWHSGTTRSWQEAGRTSSFLPSAFSAGKREYGGLEGERGRCSANFQAKNRSGSRTDYVDKAENTEREYTLLSWQRSGLNAVTVTAIFIHLLDVLFRDWSFWSQSFWTLGYWDCAQ